MQWRSIFGQLSSHFASSCFIVCVQWCTVSTRAVSISTRRSDFIELVQILFLGGGEGWGWESISNCQLLWYNVAHHSSVTWVYGSRTMCPLYITCTHTVGAWVTEASSYSDGGVLTQMKKLPLSCPALSHCTLPL